MPIGTHALVDAKGSQNPLLTDAAGLLILLQRACRDAGAIVVGSYAQPFPGPGGVTVWVCLAESSAEIHTWPEAGMWCASVFTCGELVRPGPIVAALVDVLGGDVEIETRARG